MKEYCFPGDDEEYPLCRAPGSQESGYCRRHSTYGRRRRMPDPTMAAVFTAIGKRRRVPQGKE